MKTRMLEIGKKKKFFSSIRYYKYIEEFFCSFVEP
jgi:hypothetical protein